MKKILLSTVALLAFGTVSASAADMAARTYTKAPAYAAPVYNWTGFYIGAHVGGAFTDNDSFPVAGFASTGDRGQIFGGGQVGADYQFSPNWLVGIEGQISAIDNNNRRFTSAGFAVANNNNDYLASVTGRLGYTWGPGLLYVKGGVGFKDNSNVNVTTLAGAPVAFTQTGADKTGYTVGAGLEYMFAPAWSAKIEYQYFDFDRSTLVSALAGIPAPGVSLRDDLHTIKGGINYHFNWGGPVVAKY